MSTSDAQNNSSDDPAELARRNDHIKAMEIAARLGETLSDDGTPNKKQWQGKSQRSRYSRNVDKAVMDSQSGIFNAGGAFGLTCVSLPVIVWIPFAMLDVVQTGWSLNLIFTLLSLMFGFLIASTIAAIAGFIISAVTGGMSISFVLLFNACFPCLLDKRMALTLTGGLAGFMPFGMILVIMLSSGASVLDPILAGAFLAMVFGHAGALWNADLCQNEAADRFQFGIKSLFFAMVACSCILGADQICPNHELLTMVCIYGIMQIVLVLLDRVYLLLIANRLKFAKD